MHRLVFCCLVIISLSCPLLSLPITDSSEGSYQLSVCDFVLVACPVHSSSDPCAAPHNRLEDCHFHNVFLLAMHNTNEDARLNLERLDSLGRDSLLQTLPRLLRAQTEDSPSKAGLSPSSYNPRENVKEALFGSHPQIALLSHLLAKDRKQYKKRGNLSECFWKYCV